MADTEPVSHDFPPDWGKHLTGRLVIFGKKEELSWGVELTIPVSNTIRQEIKKEGIVIPSTITSIVLLTLNPQESLPPDLRNIPTENKDRNANNALLWQIASNQNLYTTIASKDRPLVNLRHLFYLGLPSDDAKHAFSDEISNTTSNKLIIVHGHGGGEPWSIGEQMNTQPQKDTRKLQKAGNAVEVDEILKKYNDPSEIAAIMLVACNIGRKTVRARKVPVFYVQGSVGILPTHNEENELSVAFPRSTG